MFIVPRVDPTYLLLNSMTKEEVCDCVERGGGTSAWILSWERVEREGLEGRGEEEGGGASRDAEDDGIVDGNGDCSAQALQGGSY